MVQTYFNETLVFSKEHAVMPYRFKKFEKDDVVRYLVTTDNGGWAALDDDEFKQLRLERIEDEQLFHVLEEKGIILTNHNFNIIEDNYRKRYGFLFHGTSLHIIIPTLRCNHKCIYCHSSAKSMHDKSVDMDEKTAKKTLEFIFQTPAKSITIEFQGGDSTLVWDLFEYIVKEAKEMNKIFQKNIRFALVTNLILMDHDKIEFCCNEDVDICTSIDGPAEVHDFNRKMENGSNSYETVSKNKKKIEQEYSKNVSAIMVTTKQSLPYYKEIVDEYVSHKSCSLQVKYINKLGFAENTWQNIGYSMDEFIDFWKKSADYMIELNKNGTKIMDRFIGLILQKVLTKQDPSFLDFRSPCGIVIGQLAYNHNGDIYCCDEGRNFDMFKIGNVFENNYKDVISSEKSQQLISASMCENYLCDNCVYKPYCGTCPVIAYAEQNNIIPKLGQFSKCKLLKFQFDYAFEKLLFDPEVKEIFFDWLNNLNTNKNEHLHN